MNLWRSEANRGIRPLLDICVAAAFVLIVGCSSSNSGQQESSAKAARNAVLPAARTVYSAVTSAGVGWTANINGVYLACGSQDPLASRDAGSNVIQYTSSQLFTPFDHATTYGAFSHQVVKVLDVAGWNLQPQSSTQGTARYYDGHKAALDLRLVEFDNQQSLGPTATIYVSGHCFDGGSSAQKLVAGTQDNFPQPRPTVTPTPKY